MGTQVKTKQILDGSLQRVDFNQDVNSGLKHIVRVATTGPGTLASSFQNGSTVDGVTLATNDLILIKDQSAGSENGIYVVQASGAPVRATQYNTDAKIRPSSIQIKEGPSNGSKLFRCTNIEAITINTTPLVFTEVGGSSGGGSPYFDDPGTTPGVAPSATGNDAVAIGDGAIAQASNSFAIGTNSSVHVNSPDSIALGLNSKVQSISPNSIAIGKGSLVGYLPPGFTNNAYDSIAIGLNAKAYIQDFYNNTAITSAISIGKNSIAQGDYAVSIGTNSVAGYNVIAIGKFASANAQDSIVLGRNAGSNSPYGIAIGRSSTVTSSNGIAIGRNAQSLTNSYTIAIGSGNTNTDSANATGANSLAVGRGTDSTTTGSLSIGWNAQATGGVYSIAIGGGSTTALSARASAESAISLGRGTLSNSLGSIAIGWNAQATTSIYAVAIGSGPAPASAANATGIRSVAIGCGTDATNSNSVAIGNNAQATNSGSVAIGAASTGSGVSSIAILGSSSSSYSIVIGSSSSSPGFTGRNVVIGRASSTGVSSNYSVLIGSYSGLYGHSSVTIGRLARSESTSNNGITIGRSASNYSNGSIVLGYNSKVRNSASTYCISIGRNSSIGNLNSGSGSSIAIGNNAVISPVSGASGSSVVIGHNASNNNASTSIAIGYSSFSRVSNTVQISGTSISRKDDSAFTSTLEFLFGSSNEAIVMTKEIDLKTLGTVTIAVPAGSRFYPNEVGIILTTLGGTITGQPDVSFGINGTNNKFVTQTTSSLTALYARDVYTSITTEGESTLTFTVNEEAIGSADIKGRAYFKGMLVEVQ